MFNIKKLKQLRVSYFMNDDEELLVIHSVD